MTAALVTGGGSGIGRAVAVSLAEAGHGVVVADVDEEAMAATVDTLSAQGGRATAMRCDVTNPDDCEAAVAAAIEWYGPLAVACNSAGVAGRRAPIVELAADEWRHVIDVNLTGTYNSLRAEIRAFAAAGGGAIVNVASVFGMTSKPRAPAYVASKHGVIGLTRAAASETAELGVRVNAVAPGYVRTPLVADQDDPVRMAAVAARHPLGRIAEPSEVAALVAWLCSPSAAFITGAVYPIDGGFLATC